MIPVTARLAIVAALVLVPGAAFADQVQLGPWDVRSAFHIAKSENKNEVHFAIRLDEQCRLVGDEPVVAYWRDREVSEVETSELLFIERPAYDVGKVKVVSPRHVRFVLRAIPQRAVDLEVVKADDGRCVARAIAKIGGEAARLRRIFVELSGWSVDYLTIRAERLRDGVLLEERVVP